jgi:hypothetical protein
MSSNASRVPGEVHCIDHFGLNVPSIPNAKSFFTAFELENPQRIDEYRDGMARLGAAVKVVVKVGLRGRSGMRNVASALPAYGTALLGVSLLSLPVWDGTVINFPTVVLNTTAGIALALLGVVQCVRPDYWQYLTEALLGFAVALAEILSLLALPQWDWRSLAMGVAVMILATIADEISTLGAHTARRILFSPQRDGPREWIWSALGIPPGRVLVVDVVERRLTIAGKPARIFLFVATLSFSRRLYVKAYRYEHQTTWLDGLENTFFYFGGVPREVRFVNSRPFFQCDPRTKRTYADNRLRIFASYWRFSPRPGPFGCGSDSPLIRFLDESVAEGRVFASELDVQCFLDRWVGEVADRQTDPDGIEAPIERFLRAEVWALQPIAGRLPFCRQRQPAMRTANRVTIDLDASANSRR